MLRLHPILTFIFVMLSCSTMKLNHYANVKVGEKTPHETRFQNSYDITGHAVACGITGILYGGWCWAYLAMPFDSQEQQVEIDARSELKKHFENEKIEIQNEKVVFGGWIKAPKKLEISGVDKETPKVPINDKDKKNRERQFQIMLEPFGLTPYRTYSISGRFFVRPDIGIGINASSFRSCLGTAETCARNGDILGAETQFQFSQQTYVKGGMSWRHETYCADRGDPDLYESYDCSRSPIYDTRSYGFHLAIGSYWRWELLDFAIDWIGGYAPVGHNSRTVRRSHCESEKICKKEKEAVRDQSTQPQAYLLRLHIGTSF